MGKWSAYRRRGSSRPPTIPVPEILFAFAGPPDSWNSLGASDDIVTRARSPKITGVIDVTVTGVDFYVRRSGSPAGNIQGVIWSDAGAAPVLPRITESPLVAKTTMPLVGDWVHFECAPVLVLAGTPMWLGVWATLEIIVPVVEIGQVASGNTPVWFQSNAAELVWASQGANSTIPFRLWGYPA